MWNTSSFANFFIKFTIIKTFCDTFSWIRSYFILHLGMHNCVCFWLYRNTYTGCNTYSGCNNFIWRKYVFFFLDIPYHWNAYLEVLSYKNNLTSSKTLYHAAVLLYMPTDPSAFLSNHFKNLHIPRDLWSSTKGAVLHMELLHGLALC